MNYASFLPGRTAKEWISWARRIEAAGFASLWTGEVVNSALVPLAVVATATQRIQLGTGIVMAFTHSPVMMGLAALDLDLVSEGRFRLGLGVAHPNRNNNWYAGRDAGKPVEQMREYVEVVQLAMQKAQEGGTLHYQGKHYSLHAKNFFSRPAQQPRPRVPVYLAAVQKRMVALAGEVADGLIGNPLFSPKHLRDVVAPNLAEGLRRSGRQRSDIEVLGQCFTVIEDDLPTAYRIGAGGLILSIWGRVYDAVFAAHGFGEVLLRVREIFGQPQRSEELFAAIPREMVDAFCAVGPIDRVRDRLKEREEYLDTAILAVPSFGTSAEQQDHYRERILECCTT